MKKYITILQGILQGIVAFCALVCGAILMLFPDGRPLQMPVSMLAGSPFADFFFPGLILFAVIGLGHAAAAAMSLRIHRLRGLAGAVMGLGLMIWIFVQVSMIGGGHWLQNLFFAIGVAEVSLAVLALERMRER